MTHPKFRLLACAATVLVLSLPTRAQTAAPAPALRVDPVATQFPHISIVTTGRGSPVVLIPGLSSPRAVWDGQAAILAKTHQVILVQVNGFGGDAPGANLSPGVLDGIVADLHAYLAQRRLSGVPVVGHSLGGLVTLMLAKAHPADVGKAMIVDALPFVGAIFMPNATVAALQPRAAVVRDQMAAAYGQPPNPAAAEAVANGLALKPESRARVKAWALAADPRVGARAFYEDMTTDLRPDLPKLTTPLTIVVPFGGALPEATAATLYRDAYAAAPRAKVVTIGDSAHFVMLDQPAAFQVALEAFLAR